MSDYEKVMSMLTMTGSFCSCFPESISIKELKSNPLTIERFLTDAKIPEIIRHIEDQTIIYTEYVTDIIEKLSEAVQGAGYSYALYTGSDHSGLKRFLDKKVQVLLPHALFQLV